MGFTTAKKTGNPDTDFICGLIDGVGVVVKKSAEVAAKFPGDDIFAEFLFEGFIIILPDLDHAIDRSVDVLLEHALNLHEVCASSG